MKRNSMILLLGFFALIFILPLLIPHAQAADTTVPTLTSITVSSTVQRVVATFSCVLTDETALSGYVFGTDNTGTFTNETWTATSTNPQTITLTKTLNATVGTVVTYQWWANDTSNNNATSGVKTLTITGTQATNVVTSFAGMMFAAITLTSITGVIVVGTVLIMALRSGADIDSSTQAIILLIVLMVGLGLVTIVISSVLHVF
jgi:hypothetical protein